MKKIIFYIAVLSAFSVNLFSQWTFVGGFTYSGNNPASISVVDQNILWVCGGTNTPLIYRSTNGGVNWTNAVGSGITIDVFAVWGKSATECYLGDGGVAGGAGGNAKVYKTTNGGTTWQTIFQTGGTAGFINAITFSKVNSQIGVIQSDPPGGPGTTYWLQLTTNNGTNWTAVSAPGISGAASAQNSIIIIDQNFFGFGLNAGTSRVNLTTNGGTAWTTQSLGVSGAFISGFAFSIDKLRGIAMSSTSLPNIAKTTNASTWTIQNLGTGFSGTGTVKWIEGTNIIYISAGTATSGNHFRRSTDGGTTWTTMNAGSNYNIQHMEFYKAPNNIIWGYAVAGDGSCLRLVDSILLVGTGNPGLNIPTDYKLEQNYPNPFNPVTTIYYSVPKSSNIKITVYDIVGNEVMTLVNERKNAGIYSVVMDGSGLASGIYLYRITAGSFTESRKMILLK